ncbi:MAG TPA: NAD-dependent epimerase/dehydratase family protein [Mycobacteriales bacterium]
MTPAPRRIVVTGATGLLGSNVVARLLADGVEVVAFVRDKTKADRTLPASDRLSIVVGDVTDVDSVVPALPGADAVVHTAAYFREYYGPDVDEDLMERTNVEAVTRLLRAAVEGSVPAFVHVSSTGVLPDGTEEGPADEDAPLAPTSGSNRYFASKVHSELAVREFRRQHQLAVAVVRPGWMWGPGDTGPTSSGSLFLSIARGRLRAIPDVGRYAVDARDVADACVSAVGRSGTWIVGGRRHRLIDICTEVAAATGAAPPRPVPPAAAIVGAAALEAVARVRRRPTAASRRGARALIGGDRRWMSSARAEKDLGVKFRPLADTVRDEAAWFAGEGRLPSGQGSRSQNRR